MFAAPSMISTAVFRLYGHDRVGPSGEFVQSYAWMAAAIGPFPTGACSIESEHL